MSTSVRSRLARAALVTGMLAASSIPAVAQAPQQYKGRSLADALQVLQAQGLRIVFSSAIVTPEMRVNTEPRGRTARRQLDELLAPHGLKGKNGPGGTVQIVRAKPSGRVPRAAADATTKAAVADAVTATPHVTYNEYVSVSRPSPSGKDHGVASQSIFDRSDFGNLYGSLAEDPVRAVQALPRVAPVDEARSEFAVRGSGFRHVNFVVDGMPTHWLQHTAYDRGTTGSLPMLAGQVLDGAMLQAGAYPRRHGDRLGPQLELTIREGSRTRVMMRGAVGGTNATLVGEGPVGGSGRGSWLAVARRSYLEWPVVPEAARTPFAFSDGLARLVYDVNTSQQFTLGILAGASNIDVEDEDPARDLMRGKNRATAVNVSWRSTFGSGAVLRQRAFVVRQYFVNEYTDGREPERGANQEAVYRADLTRAVARGVFESGIEVGRTHVDDGPRGGMRAFTGSAWSRSAYAHFAWAATPTLTLSPGARITASTLLHHRAVSRWLLSEWSAGRGWTLSASAGASAQLPELRFVLGEKGSTNLRPERASYVDISVERRLTRSMRWQATAFSRMEHDILREPDLYPRLVGDAFVLSEKDPYVNALSGKSRGIEMLVDRKSSIGLSGWASYSYGKTRYTDLSRAETYWGDFDQRHALNLFGTYRFATHTSLGATFRAGGNFPIPAYLAARNGRLFVGSNRNEIRLAPYARLDVRAEHKLAYAGRRVTLFVELFNALNRANASLAGGSIDTTTGEAIGITDTLFRRRASAGLVVAF